MKNIITIILLCLFVVNCTATTSTVRPVIKSSLASIPGKVKIELRNTSWSVNVKPRSYLCSAWDYPVNLTGVNNSLKRSINSSFTNNGKTYNVIIDMEDINVSVLFTDGFWNLPATSNVDISFKIAIYDNGELIQSRNIYSSANLTQALLCDTGHLVIEEALTKATRKAVTQVTDFLDAFYRTIK